MATSKHSHDMESREHNSTDQKLHSITSTTLSCHATFPFFNLPPEISNRVYSLAFPTQPSRKSRLPHYCRDDTRRYTYYLPDFKRDACQWEDSPDKTSSHLLRVQFQMWPPVNQQFLIEAIEVFIRDKVFDITSYDDGKCPEDRNFWLRGFTATEKPDAVYGDLFLVRAIRSIKAPKIQNSWSPIALRFSKKRDEETIMVFSRLRGAVALPPNLELEWIYYLDYPKKSDNPPTISSPLLGSWRNKFAKVVITVTIQDSHLYRLKCRGALTASMEEELRFIYSKVHQQAAAWARSLVKYSNEAEKYFGISKEVVKTNWTTIGTSTRTVEAVDCDTKPTRPLKTLHYE
jgi:hypothetical protein